MLSTDKITLSGILCLALASLLPGAEPVDQAEEQYIVRYSTDSIAAKDSETERVTIEIQGDENNTSAKERPDRHKAELIRRSKTLAKLAENGQKETFAYVENWLRWQELFQIVTRETSESPEDDAITPPDTPKRESLEAYLAAKELALRENEAEEKKSNRESNRETPPESAKEEKLAAQGRSTPTRREIDFLNQQTNFRYERLIDYYLSTGRDPRVLIPNHYVAPANPDPS